MSFSRFRKPTSENITYTGAYVNIAPTALSNVANHDKYLHNDATGNLVWEGVNTANKLLRLNANALIDSNLLPSYVDDVMEFANLASFPLTGETGKIYVDLATNYYYRWSGSTYINVQSDYSYSKATTDTKLNLKSNIANPTFTGTVTAPTITATTIQSTDGFTTEVIDANGCLITAQNGLSIKHNVNGYVSQEMNGTGMTISSTNLPITINAGSSNVTIPKLSSTTGTITTLTAPTINNTNSSITGTATIGTCNATSGTITTLGSTTGNITTLNSTTGNITGTATIGTCNATSGTITTLGSTTATIGTCNATSGNITTLNSTTGNITGTATIGTCNATSGTITTLGSTTGNITTLNSTTGNITGTATIGTCNATSGTITTLGSTTGNITTLNSTTGNITGTATIGACNATSGTITTLNSTTANLTTVNSGTLQNSSNVITMNSSGYNLGTSNKLIYSNSGTADTQIWGNRIWFPNNVSGIDINQSNITISTNGNPITVDSSLGLNTIKGNSVLVQSNSNSQIYLDSTNGLYLKGLSGKQVKMDCDTYANAVCNTSGFRVTTNNLNAVMDAGTATAELIGSVCQLQSNGNGTLLVSNSPSWAVANTLTLVLKNNNGPQIGIDANNVITTVGNCTHTVNTNGLTVGGTGTGKNINCGTINGGSVTTSISFNFTTPGSGGGSWNATPSFASHIGAVMNITLWDVTSNPATFVLPSSAWSVSVNTTTWNFAITSVSLTNSHNFQLSITYATNV